MSKVWKPPLAARPPLPLNFLVRRWKKILPQIFMYNQASHVGEIPTTQQTGHLC